MKKLIGFIFAVVLLVGCTQDFKKDIKPENDLDGVTIQIDSTKWQPALIQIEGSELTIYESGKIRKVILRDPIVYFYAFIVTALMLMFLLGWVTKD